jgi:hypothetical protein
MNLLQQAHHHFSTLEVSDYFDAKNYFSDYVFYLREHNVMFTLETLKQIEDIQRIYTSARTGISTEIFIPRQKHLGLQNWYLVNSAIEKNPLAVSKNFTTEHVEELAESVFDVDEEMKERNFDFVSSHFDRFINLPKGYLTTRSTAVGKYSHELFKKLRLGSDRRLISDIILFGQYISASEDKNMDQILRSFFKETYRLMLLLEDLKVL